MGFAASGRVGAPPKHGQATLIGYSNGSIDVRTWTPAVPTPVPMSSSHARTCPLMVEQGQLDPALEQQLAMGHAARQRPAGLALEGGVNAHGNLIYAAA